MTNTIDRIVTLDPKEIVDFCGRNDDRIREIEQRSRTRIVTRGNQIKITGSPENVSRTAEMIEELRLIHNADPSRLTKQHVRKAMDLQEVEPRVEAVGDENSAPRPVAGQSGGGARVSDIFLDKIELPIRHKSVAPMTGGQKNYLDAIRKNDIVFGVGPAGTGKTYLACAMAVHYLLARKVRRIILSRPAVEAGERLGFLPGDLEAKINPYLRPLYDALYEMMELERAKELIETNVIEVAPLAFMRGRTLNSAFVILDEAQNTSNEQMKMFLTRLGFDSKAVITGDVTQIDLERHRESGLIGVRRILKDIDGIAFCDFDGRDVVRHELVQKIVNAYDRHDAARERARQSDRPAE